ncbi:MAG: PIN domain-containing protein [Bacteroidetes bacterium]|nr:PIN domain-containing protein [Bacteroidota bacterium]MBS1540821.1 PIN domain-containing protein [Bacteroidota bacterium]
MRVNKFVLDCNILIRYFAVNHLNFLLDILEYFPDTKFYYCKELLDEFSRVAKYPRLTKANIDVKKSVEFIKEFFTEHKLNKPIKKRILADPGDDFVFALALETNSGYLVSEDDEAFHNNKTTLYKKYPHLKFLYKKEFKKLFTDKLKRLHH